jgi:hypothetical protein
MYISALDLLCAFPVQLTWLPCLPPPPGTTQHAQAFTYFDKDNDAQLTVREMKDSVTAVFKERKNMAHSLKVSGRLRAAQQHCCAGRQAAALWQLAVVAQPAATGMGC